MNASAILLSGGKSSRMGTNKALLTINEQPNIARIRDTLGEHFAETILVTNDPETYQFLQINIVSDQYPGMGPLAGLHAGLVASSHEVNVLVACDMPFVSGELAAVMAERCGNYDAVIPVIAGKQHPLFAVFKKTAAEEAENCIKAGNLRMKHLLDRLNVLYLTEIDFGSINQLDLEQVFFNMNHPDEYEDAKNWAKS